MCGFVGYIDGAGSFNNQLIYKMMQPISHRGPNDRGVYIDSQKKLALGHNRLSILDLSDAGKQPMMSKSGRYVIAYNGEVYNYQAIGKELEHYGIQFQGHSDTEVIIASIEQWGLHQALNKFVGMFAFALWDQQRNCLSLVRDRIGIKPLYFGWMNGTLLFSSELKALRPHPHFKNDIDLNALQLFLKLNYVPAPVSIYKGIFKLRPGCIHEFKFDATMKNCKENEKPYWILSDIIKNAHGQCNHLNEAAIEKQLEDLLKKAIACRLISDVPLGAFLSGGVDSSTVVALMKECSSTTVKTFSIGFYEHDYNEAIYAKQIAQYLNTDHTELYVSSDEARSVIPLLPEIYDEPFADSSQIPTYLVSKLAKTNVTVSLSGDGGDELFGGYNRYYWGNTIWRLIGKVPPSSRNLMTQTLLNMSPSQWNRLFNLLSVSVRKKLIPNNIGDKIHKFAHTMYQTNDSNEFYDRMVSFWHFRENVVIRKSNNNDLMPFAIHESHELKDFANRMMLSDMMTYLPDDILVKLDRASMAVSLEARVPLLDHRVIEMAWSIPLSMKIKGNQGKRILKQILYKYVPKHFIERPKMGFGVPIGKWLRGPLKDWAFDLMNEQRLKQEGFLNYQPIIKKWNDHQSGIRNWQDHLWGVLMFQAWLNKWA